ncbi:hypothetical protein CAUPRSCDRAFT_12000, partial [Caulochytrium protostelioides]
MAASGPPASFKSPFLIGAGGHVNPFPSRGPPLPRGGARRHAGAGSEVVAEARGGPTSPPTPTSYPSPCAGYARCAGMKRRALAAAYAAYAANADADAAYRSVVLHRRIPEQRADPCDASPPSSRAGAPPSATATPTAALSVLTRLNLEAQRAERRSEDDLLAHLHDGSRPGAVSTPTGSTASESASRVARRVTAPRTAGPASAGPGPPSMAAARRHYPVLRSSPPSASPGTAPSRSAGGLPAIARAEPWSASSTVTTTAPSRSSHEMAPQSILIDAPSAQRYPDTDLEGETAFHDDADLAQLAQAAATGSVVVQDPAGAVAVSQLGIGPSGTPGILAGRSTLQNTRILAPVPEASEFDHWWR